MATTIGRFCYVPKLSRISRYASNTGLLYYCTKVGHIGHVKGGAEWVAHDACEDQCALAVCR